MEPYISALIKYFNKELPKLKDSYQWKIPNIDGFNKSGEKGYEANIQLKIYLNTQWNKTKNNESLSNLAKIIVSDWGGVRNNKRTTLESYVKELKKDTPSTPIEGVAS